MPRPPGTPSCSLGPGLCGERLSVGLNLGQPRQWLAAIGPALHLIPPLAFGGLLAALQLLPTAELLRLSPRAAAAGFDFVMTYSLSPWRLLTLAVPDLLGNPSRGQFFGHGNYWEDALYVGLLPLLLAAVAVWRALRGRRSGAELDGNRAPGGPLFVPLLTVVLIVTLALALGANTPVFPFLYRYVPTFNLFQAPARTLVWFEFALALLAGVGVGQLGQLGGKAKYGLRLCAAGAVSVTVTAMLVMLVVPATASLDVQLQAVSRAVAAFGLVLFLVSLLLLGRPADREDGARMFRWELLAAGMVAADLIYAGWGLNPGASPQLYHGPSPSAAALSSALDGHRLYQSPDDDLTVRYGRLLSFKSFGGPASAIDARAAELANVALLDGLQSSNNYDPLVIARYADMMNFVASPGAGRLLPLMDAGVVASSRPLSLEVVSAVGPVTFYRAPGQPRRARVVYAARTVPNAAAAQTVVASDAFDPDNEVILEADDLGLPARASSPLVPSQAGDSFAVSLSQPGWVVISDTCYPGWSAAIDGRPVPLRCGDYAFWAVAAPAGNHVVTLRYGPATFATGFWLSLAAWVVWLAVGLAGWRARFL